MSRDLRRGNATYSVVTMLMLLGFTALAVDIGHLRATRAELQNAADVAAHAGVAYLDGTADGVTAARAAVVGFAALNEANGTPVVLDPDTDVTFGVYDYDDGSFTPGGATADINAVQVDASRAAVSMYFASAAFGVDSLAAGAQTIATRGQTGGAGATRCFLPFALPTCLFDGRTDEALNLTDLRLQPATGDNLGWANPFGNPTPVTTLAQLNGTCASSEISMGDPVHLGNGAEQSSLTYVSNALVASTTTWSEHGDWGTQPARMTGSDLSPSEYGRTLEGPIILFDGGAEYCDADASTGSWNRTATIAGFAWGAIYDVRSSGSVHNRNVKMRLELLENYEFGTSGGGPDHGITYTDPSRIVY